MSWVVIIIAKALLFSFFLITSCSKKHTLSFFFFFTIWLWPGDVLKKFATFPGISEQKSTMILPEDIYALYVESDPPDGFDSFGVFGCAECQHPVGIKKPEGIADFPTKPKQQDGQHRFQGQHNNQNRFFNKNYKNKQQQHNQQVPKKMAPTVEVSPAFSNVNLGTWTKKPATGNEVHNDNSNVSNNNNSNSNSKPIIGFNPQKTTSSQQHIITQQNQQPPPPQQIHQQHQETATPAQPVQNQQNRPQQQHKVEEHSHSQATGWGKPVVKPKQKQSFASLLEKESEQPAFNDSLPHNRPTNTSPSIAVAPPNDANWPSIGALNNKAKKASAWGNVKP